MTAFAFARPRRAVVRLLALALCAFLAVAQVGCADKQQTLDRIDSAIVVVERSAAWMDAADGVAAQIEAGALPWSLAWEQLRPVVPDNLERRVDAAIAAGVAGTEALREVILAARADRDRALADLRLARQKVEQAEDPMEVAAAATEAGLGLVALIAGSGVLTTAVAGVIAVIRALKAGRRQGATEVAAIAAAGRVANPALDAIYEDDANPATRAMKARMGETWPEVADAIKAANAAAGVHKLPAPKVA